MISSEKRQRSIRGKLIVLLTATTGILLTIVLLALFSYDITTFRTALGQKTTTIAKVIAENVAAAMLFNDQDAARTTLGGLRADPNILNAAVITPEGRTFVTFTATSTAGEAASGSGTVDFANATALQGGFRFNDDTLSVTEPVLFDDDLLGYVVVHSALTELNSHIRSQVMVFIIAVTITVFSAFLAALRLQKLIADPIRNLATVMRRVSRDRDYNVQVPRHSADEVGELVDGFNAMMEQIHTRDRQLAALIIDLREAKQDAETASHAKSQFLANMSHELRTPLNAILGYAEMLLEDCEKHGRRNDVEDLRKVIAAGKHLLTLINEVLDFSKLDAGKMTFHHQPFDVDTLLREVVDVARPLVEKNGNRFEQDIATPLGTMTADPVRVKQCLYNLLSNSAKFTHGGVVRLTARREPDSPQDRFCFSIQDNGIGISEEYLSRVFDAFSQADEKSTRRFGGTGLGLAITQRLCSQMGGTITVTSQLGGGSTFTIVLPAEASAPDAPDETDRIPPTAD